MQALENAIDDVLSCDIGAGNITLTTTSGSTLGQWESSAGFYLTGTSTSGRTFTVPAKEGVRFIQLDSAWTHNVSIVRGSTTLTLQPGGTVWIYTDGTTNGLRVVGRSGAGALAFLNLSDTFTSYTSKGGQALRVNAGATGVEAYQPPYDIYRYVSGALTASQVLVRVRFVRAVRIPAGLTLSALTADVAATASTVIAWQKNGGANFGTATFAIAGTIATMAAASDTDFAAGDVLTLTAPASPDATLAGIDISVAGLKL